MRSRSARKKSETIDCGESQLVEVTGAAGTTVLYTMEEEVVGTWGKWTNNSGFADADPGAAELLRFSQWTHE